MSPIPLVEADCTGTIMSGQRVETGVLIRVKERVEGSVVRKSSLTRVVGERGVEMQENRGGNEFLCMISTLKRQ